MASTHSWLRAPTRLRPSITRYAVKDRAPVLVSCKLAQTESRPRAPQRRNAHHSTRFIVVAHADWTCAEPLESVSSPLAEVSRTRPRRPQSAPMLHPMLHPICRLEPQWGPHRPLCAAAIAAGAWSSGPSVRSARRLGSQGCLSRRLRPSPPPQQIISRLSADGLGNQHGVEGGAAEELVAAHKQVEPVLTEDVVLTEAANLNVVFGRGRQRHRVQV